VLKVHANGISWSFAQSGHTKSTQVHSRFFLRKNQEVFRTRIQSVNVGWVQWIDGCRARSNKQVGFWWKSSEPGWGLSVQQQGTSTFAAWFTYNAQAQPIWYTLTCTFNGNTCAGDLYTASGTPFYQISTSVVLQS
jgi:hypothetical protein